jgi:type IV pilus assembly protein PilM
VAKKGLIGLDIGSYYTKVVEIREKKGIANIESIAKTRTPDGLFVQEKLDEDIAAEFLQSFFSENKIKNKNVAVALNSSFVITKTITMPLVVDEEIEQAVMWEAEQYAPFGMDQVNVSYQVMNKNTDKNEMTVLLVLTKKEIVNSYKEAFSKAKLNIEILDVDIFALANCFFRNEYELSSKHNMLIDVGYNSTKLIFTKNEIPTFSRYVDFGFKYILEEAASIFSVSMEEAGNMFENMNSIEDDKKDTLISFVQDKTAKLYVQLQNSIGFYEANVLNSYDELDNIVFSGVLGVMFDYLKNNMPEDILNKNVMRIKPFSVFVTNSSGIEDISSSINSLYSIAVGLAVRGL